MYFPVIAPILIRVRHLDSLLISVDDSDQTRNVLYRIIELGTPFNI